jgi:ankyrin repeat protein
LLKGALSPDELTLVKQQIVNELFNAISREDAQDIALLITHNLVTANTTSKTGQTPLLAAVSTKNIAIVREVLDLGADCNKFGVVVSDHLLGYRRPIYS